MKLRAYSKPGRVSGSRSTINLKAGTMTRIIHMLCEATNGYIFWKRGNNDCEFWEELLTPHVRSTSMFSIFDTFSSGGLDFNVILAGKRSMKKTEKNL